MESKLSLAAKHHQAGNLAEAETLYRRILKAEPRNPDAHHLFGVLAHQLGRNDQAVEYIQQAIRLHPKFPAAHNNLGITLKDLGKLDEAIASYLQALRLKPDFAEAYYNLGNALKEKGRLEEAITNYQHALRLKPNYVNALTGLGLVLQKLARPVEALSYHQQALAHNPGSAEVLNDLGLTLAELSRHAEAIPYYQRALAIQPNLASAHNSLGICFAGVNQHAEAVACYQRAITADPELADAYFNLGNMLRTLGRIQESRQALEKAMGLAPHRIDYFYNLAESHRFAANDPLLTTMEALDKPGLSADQRIFLHFGLGKVYADLDRPEDALRHLCEGNRLQRQRIQYDEGGTLSVFQRVATVFSPELMRAKAGSGDPSALPVFIVGMPRSGSTLLEQVLSSHPKVFGAGEITAFAVAASKLEGLDAPLEPVRTAMESLTVRELRALAPGAERISDKGLGNFVVVGLIHLALPNARILHIRRDPIDTCVSCFSKWFSSGQQQSYDLAELGRYYRAYEELMEHWRRVLPKGVMLDVRYEDLVEDLEPQARRVISHCGLDWDQRCLDFHKSERPVTTASAAQVRQPIYRSSVGRWRSWKGLLQPMLNALGLPASATNDSDANTDLPREPRFGEVSEQASCRGE
jgi:tetratricopeptide (TPR) repeat protein